MANGRCAIGALNALHSADAAPARSRRSGRYRHRPGDGAGGPAQRRRWHAPVPGVLFGDFAGSGQFDLIVPATAFHWVDPGTGLAKAARLLRPGGWLALLTTEERYPEPLGSRLRELWMRYSRQSSGWPGQPAWLTALRASGLFGAPVEVSHTRALRLPAETVLDAERTRATFLSYTEQDRAGFTADLQALVMPGSQIDLRQETFLAMAQTAA